MSITTRTRVTSRDYPRFTRKPRSCQPRSPSINTCNCILPQTRCSRPTTILRAVLLHIACCALLQCPLSLETPPRNLLTLSATLPSNCPVSSRPTIRLALNPLPEDSSPISTPTTIIKINNQISSRVSSSLLVACLAQPSGHSNNNNRNHSPHHRFSEDQY